jgi:hypothetical protein
MGWLRLAIVVAALLGGCSPVDRASPSPSHSNAPTPPSPTVAASEAPPRSLPAGFPVLPGAVSVELPADDPGLIALWETGDPGSAAYDFYTDALPAAGYPIVGLYPGGGVALIRFEVDGEVWQMVAHGSPDGRVAIEIRLDRP